MGAENTISRVKSSFEAEEQVGGGDGDGGLKCKHNNEWMREREMRMSDKAGWAQNFQLTY